MPRHHGPGGSTPGPWGRRRSARPAGRCPGRCSSPRARRIDSRAMRAATIDTARGRYHGRCSSPSARPAGRCPGRCPSPRGRRIDSRAMGPATIDRTRGALLWSMLVTWSMPRHHGPGGSTAGPRGRRRSARPPGRCLGRCPSPPARRIDTRAMGPATIGTARGALPWSMPVTTGPEDRQQGHEGGDDRPRTRPTIGTARGAFPWSMLVTTGPEDRQQGRRAGDDRQDPRGGSGRCSSPGRCLVTTGPEDRQQGHGPGDDRHGPRGAHLVDARHHGAGGSTAGPRGRRRSERPAGCLPGRCPSPGRCSSPRGRRIDSRAMGPATIDRTRGALLWSMPVTIGTARGALPWSMPVTTGPEDRQQGHEGGDDRHRPRGVALVDARHLVDARYHWAGGSTAGPWGRRRSARPRGAHLVDARHHGAGGSTAGPWGRRRSTGPRGVAWSMLVTWSMPRHHGPGGSTPGPWGRRRSARPTGLPWLPERP